MSENTQPALTPEQQEALELAKIARSIGRNNVTLVFSGAKVSRGTQNKGKVYLVPPKPEEKEELLSFYDKLIKFVGIETVGSWAYTFFKRQCQSWSFAATVNGEFDEAAFDNMVKICAIVRKNLSMLYDELEDVNKALLKLSDNTELAKNPVEFNRQARELIEQMKRINQEIEGRKRNKGADDDDD